MNKINSVFEKLANKIKESYEAGVTMENAEKLAAEFLHAQILVSNELKVVDLDARMRKTGFKAVAAAMYLEIANGAEKKPSDTYIENVVNSNKIIQDTKDQLDAAEVSRDELQNYLNIFKEAHIYYRSISRGRFE